jgi:hypothetical protein
VQTGALAQISTDAGLTPAQDRWIARTQYRMMGMENNMMKTKVQMVPVVLGYGITSGISIMARSVYVHKSYSNSEVVDQGINDLYVLSKFRLFRKNTSKYTFGIAPYLASNIPIGSKEVSERTWNPELGLNVSFRPRFLSMDLSTSYTFIDVAEKVSTEHINGYKLDISFSGKIPIGTKSNQIVSPVTEFNFSGASDLLFISPGVSYMHTYLAIEALYQIPVYESEEPGQMKHTSRWIIGLKYLF